ncbi:PKD domain-containing protein [Marinifilum fragile]|uniref:PKD domain-containing protein n=1 Tax=Marinifilum fragile TaxID=570161 RepID=UPI002AA6D446|nr:PKD domain-containing protein [Marinifilum fragile]
MKNIFLVCVALIVSLTICAQTPFKTKKENNTKSNSIVITEATYNNLTSQIPNLRKLSKISDKQNGVLRIPDDPNARVNYETRMLIDPTTGKVPNNIREQELKFALAPQSGLRRFTKAGGLNFYSAGPKNVGGRTRALAIDIANDNTILAGGVSGGLWKSTDNGSSWNKVTELKNLHSITAIAQDPREGNRNTWYYATGELRGNSASSDGAPFRGDGIFKSTNNGETWQVLASTVSNTPQAYDPFDYSWNICIDPTNGNVYVATANGIRRSTDGGNSWEVVIDSDSYYSDVICTPSGVLYAALSDDGNVRGIFRSESGASGSWTNITPDQFPVNFDRIVLSYAPSNEKSVYLLAATPDGGFENHSLWKLEYETSSNYKWSDRSNNIPATTGDVGGYNSQGSYNMLIKVAPDNENIVFIGGTNLHRSDDGFATNNNTYWIGGYSTKNNVTQYENHHPDIHSMAFKSDKAGMICGHDGGLSLTSNYKQTEDTDASDGVEEPVDWTDLNNGYLTTQAYTVAIDHDIFTNKSMVAGFQDNGTWNTNDATSGGNWSESLSGDGSYCAITDQGKAQIVSWQNGGMYLLYTNGNWTRINPEEAEGQLFINPFIVDANNSEIVYSVGGNYIWRNSNIFGIPLYSNSSTTVNWEKMEESKASGTITTFASSTYPSHILYYGSSNGKVYKMENSHSADAKKTDITGNGMPTNAYVSSIDVNPLNADEVLVAFSNYKVESIFYSSNGGTSWIAVSGNLEENGNVSGSGPSVRTVSILVSPSDTTYYAGTSTGLYSTTKLNGSSTVWTQEAANTIGNTVVSMIKNRGDGFIGVGTHANGIYYADVDYSSATPVANIGTTADTIFIGEKVNFKDRSIGEVSAYLWTFEGAETASSTSQHPENILYNTAGKYKVSLKVSNAHGDDTKVLESAIVVKSVLADFTASTTTVNVGDEVTFTDKSSGTVSAWEWNFSGGTTDDNTVQNPVVTFSQSGVYTVTLKVTGSGSFTDTESKIDYITVINPADKEDDILYNVLAEDESKLSVYSFNGETSWGYVTGHNSYSMSEFAEKFEMINTNLNIVRSVQLNPVIIESKSSDPKIQLKIWNGTDAPGTEVYSQNIPLSQLQKNQFNEIILDTPVEVENDFFVGYKIFFENPLDTFAVYHLPLDGEITWDNSAYLKYNNTWYPYSSPSIFEANSALAIKVKVGYEDAESLLVPEFTASSTSIIAGEEVTFTDQSTGNITGWEWTFDGGTTDDNTVQHPVVTYDVPGIYTVTLKIKGEDGTSNTATKVNYITVINPADKEDDLLYNISAEDESKLSVYSFNGETSWGYVTGHNSYSMSEFAEKFEMTNPNLNVVRSIQLNPVIVESESGDPKIQLKIWNGTDAPGTEVYSKDIPLSQLKTNQFNEIILDTPVEVENDFFVGYKIFFENPLDTFAVYHLPLDGEITWNNSAYLKYNNTWYPYSSPSIFEANSALAIKVKVGYENIGATVSADFTASSTTIYAGEEIVFTDQSYGEIASWEWIVPGGTIADNTEQNPTVQYKQAGTFSVTLKVTDVNGATASKTKTDYIIVDVATAIDDLDEENKRLLIYPNPMVNKVNVKFPNQTNQKYRLVVVDANGKVVRIIENITNDNIIINREQLKPGLHILNLSGEKIYKAKLLVQ